MSLSKQQAVDKIEVLENGSIQVRNVIRIIENDSVLSSSYHRYIIAPGDDYSKEDARVQGICSAVHTPEVVAAYQAMLAEQERNRPGVSSGE